MLGHFWSHVAQFSEHVCEHVSAATFDGFWQASELSFFDFRRGENTIFTFLLRSLLASFSTPKTLPKSEQIGPKRAPKSIKKVIEKFVEFGIDFYSIFGPFLAKMEVLFRGGQISKIFKIRALGSKCDPSLQDGLPGTQNTQKSSKDEPPGLQNHSKS